VEKDAIDMTRTATNRLTLCWYRQIVFIKSRRREIVALSIPAGTLEYRGSAWLADQMRTTPPHAITLYLLIFSEPSRIYFYGDAVGRVQPDESS
jgi:hypothetical protein